MEYVSLLKTTQNTREMGGYRTGTGAYTRIRSVLRSDVQYHPCPEDLDFLLGCGITTIIDLRSQSEAARKPSGFARADGFVYRHIPIEEGSGVPRTAADVPVSYMAIASARNMPEVFRCIAHAESGVMINCTAGKDRTGVVAAILLLHAGVSDGDIVENYVLTKEYGRERLALVHKNYPEIDMNIVTPCEMYMEKFLTLLRERYGDTMEYFRKSGLTDAETGMILNKLV